MHAAATTYTPLHCNALLPISTDSVLVGQYEHSSEESKRAGRIDILRVVSGDDDDDEQPNRCSIAKDGTLDLPHCGVFDIVHSRYLSGFPPHSCAAACTDGSVKFIDVSADQKSLDIVVSVKMDDEMMTSFSASSSSEAGSFLVSTHHKGTLSVHAGAEKRLSFEAHEYDAWCHARLPSSSMLLTGGDDAKMKLWDSRTFTFQDAAADDLSDDSETAPPPPRPVQQCNFEAGVVTIVPQSEHIVLVGTYDEYVHSIDVRMMKPKNHGAISSVRVGGGAWRLRELPTPFAAQISASKEKLFSVAAMQGGAALVSFDEESHEVKALEWSVVGGGDAKSKATTTQPLLHTESKNSDGKPMEEPLIYDCAVVGGDFLVTASFYANEVKVWRM